MDIRQYFSSEQVNHGRQTELDLLKGIAIFFMVWVHVANILNVEQNWAYAVVYDVLGSPYAAPMFMIALGVGVCFSHRKSAARLAFRAVSLFIVGLVLNVMRCVLPSLLYNSLLGYSHYSFQTLFTDLFSVDILQFASLAFLFLAFCRWRNWPLKKMVLFGVLASLLAWMLRWKATGNLYANVLLGWIWGTDETTCFPFLGWIIFPIAGMCIGHAMLHCRDKYSVYLRVSPVCLLLGTGYVWYSFFTQSLYLSDAANYFFLNTVDAFFIILLAIGLLGLCALLVHLCQNWSFPLLTRLSRNINAVYCIHWTLLMFFSVYCYAFMPYYQFSFTECTVLTVILLLISDGLAALYAAKIRPALHATAYSTRQHPAWQPAFRAIRAIVPRTVNRSFRALNAMLFAGGVSLTSTDKPQE